MALTNSQITAQNFKDFYNGIRPYLNGQVPTFANAFNRSDLYSTDEKIIGCWTDGKPLYQRTFIKNSLTNNDWNTEPHGIADIDLIVNAFGGVLNTSSGGFNNEGYFGSGGIEAYASRTNVELYVNMTGLSNVHKGIVTLQYTKTTDSAIKVGTGNDYSTDEQIIGTWVDSKPLYQKTFLNFAPTNTVLIENVDTVVYWNCLRNLSGTDTNWYQIADGNENTNDLSVKIDNHNLKLVPPGSYYNAGNVVHATFQYTKTS